MKLKEQLIEMGLTEELAKKVAEEVIDGNYIPKSRFNEVNEENKTLKQSVADRDTQLEELKKSSGDNEELKKQIESLQQQNKEQKENYETQMSQIKLDNAVESALTTAGAKNNKAIKALIDMALVKLGDDGKLTGFDEQLKAVQKSDAYLFAEKEQAPANNFKGFQPGTASNLNPGKNVDTSKMGYAELAAYMTANPNVEIS